MIKILHFLLIIAFVKLRFKTKLPFEFFNIFKTIFQINGKENDRAELVGKATGKQAIVTSREIRTRSLSRTRKPLSSVNLVKPPIPPAAKAQVKDVQIAETSKPKIAVKAVKTESTTTAAVKAAVVVKTTATLGILPRPTKTQVKIIKKQPDLPKVPAKPRKSDSDKSESSLYVSALEELK